ncbi:MAG: DNA alkylation repair protein [Pseudomonadota bacterium]
MEPFKNAISPDLVKLIAVHLGRQLPAFDRAGFTGSVIEQLPSLELKQRVSLIADAIHEVLPSEGGARHRIMLAMLHPDDENRANQPSTEDGLCGWGVWPLTQVVGKHGLSEFDASLDLLREMTKRGTAEFDVRPFLVHDQRRAIDIMAGWVDDSNEHVRRLVSEGTRPRLPWGIRLNALIQDPTPTLPLLQALRDNPSDYVRRSVANHMNDIAKDHADLVAGLAHDWMKGASSDRVKLIRHACRTLIKRGHAPTLAAFGLKPPDIRNPQLQIIQPDVAFGNGVEFEVVVHSKSNSEQKLVLDYVVHFRKAKGSLAPKVFKWTTITLQPSERRELKRYHAIKPITTRRYYPGKHALSLRINGHDFEHVDFNLVMPE